MADKNFSSANKAISVSSAKPKGLNPKALLGGMTKDVKKRWMMVGAIGIAIMVLASSMASSRKAPEAPVKKDVGVVDTTPKGMSSQKDWKAQTGAEMATLKKQFEESQRSQRELMSSVEMLRKELTQRPAGAPAAAAQPVGTSGANLSLPPPPEPPRSLVTGIQAPAGAASGVSVQPPAPAVAPEPKRASARAFIPTPTAADAAAADETRIEEMALNNERRGTLPANSFVKATLLSGVEAFTGGTAQSQPQPLVVRLDANAVLPNAAAYDIKGCHVLASVWGDLSSERVFGRLATLTCVDTNNRLVLSEEVEGAIMDSDGKNGIRGEVQDRQGAKLARSLLAGFAQGMSTAMGAAQSTVTQTAFGATSSVDPSKIFKSSSYSGAEKAAQTLSEFYLKQAEATMPVIAIDVGRKIHVVFTKSKPLKFETIDNYKVKPKERVFVERKVG